MSSTPMDMEHRHRDALQRIYQAEQIWSEQGNLARSFLLLHTGGMQSHVDHPGWDESWLVPSEHTIDDLAEMGMLRVDPSPNKARTFVPTVAGRQSAAELLRADVATALPSTPTAQRAASTVPSGALANPTALLSWAHDTATWQTTLVEFAVLLRRYGVNADIDLFELHNPNVNWSTWGPDAIERSEFVLLAVSANYRERWEDRGDPTEGAGAAREANVLKTLFNQDRAAFYPRNSGPPRSASSCMRSTAPRWRICSAPLPTSRRFRDRNSERYLCCRRECSCQARSSHLRQPATPSICCEPDWGSSKPSALH
jgi:hypothetical protein